MNMQHFGIELMRAMYYAEATAPRYKQLCLAIALEAAYQTHRLYYWQLHRRGFLDGRVNLQYGVRI